MQRLKCVAFQQNVGVKLNATKPLAASICENLKSCSAAHPRLESDMFSMGLLACPTSVFFSHPRWRLCCKRFGLLFS